MPSDDMKMYYALRAPEYERIYEKPERQRDLTDLRNHLVDWTADRNVLEVACGTGYWTLPISRRACSILATDVNHEVLAIARTKDYGPATVRFVVADAYDSPLIHQTFDAALAAFWWSHVPIERREEFLHSVASRLSPEAVLILCDNTFVAGESTPIHRKDACGNTFQRRTLSDGSEHEVLKNHCGNEELREVLSRRFGNFEYTEWKYYWCMTCMLNG